MWCQHLRDAQLCPTLERIAVIRDELKNLTGSDPLETAVSTSSESKQTSADDEG